MRILFLTPRFPYPPLKGDSLRTYQQIKALSRRHEITLLSMCEDEITHADHRKVSDLCSRVEVVPIPRWRALINLALGLPSNLPMQVSYYRSSAYKQQLDRLLAQGDFDVVHATLIRTLPYVWRLSTTPLVVDLIDSLTLNLEDRRGKVQGPMRLGYELEYRRVRDYEQRVVRHFQALTVSSPTDKKVLGGSPRVTVIPNGVDVEQFPFYPQAGRDAATLIFTGNMGYHPNEEAVTWFAAQVWPGLRAAHPNLRFQIVGTNPGEKVRALADGSNGIEVLGKVADLCVYLGRATLAVAPMHTGSGIQNKVLEAMATGTPVVSTTIANRGVGGLPDCDLLLADSPAQFMWAVTRLLKDAHLRQRLAAAGREYVEGHFQWKQHAEQLTCIYGQMAASAAREARRPVEEEQPLVWSGF